MDFKAKLGIAAVLVAFVIGTSTALGDSHLFIRDSNGVESNVLRLGYFPNITHAAAVIGYGSGDYQTMLGQVKLERQVFNAGPAAIESLFAGRVDCVYVGPNPAINGYLQSGGSLKVISGVSSGGAVFVVRNGAGISSDSDFADKKLASPQLGNTQDVALRHYLKERGYDVRLTGGNPEIFPAKPSDIVVLMSKGELDGAWVPEPWGARLVREVDSRIYLDERDLWPDGKFSSALIACRTDYIEANSDTVKNLLLAHVRMTEWINEDPGRAIAAFNSEMAELLGTTIDENDMRQSFSRMEFSYDMLEDTIVQSAHDANEIGLLARDPDLSGMFDSSYLDAVTMDRR
jgi:NitT/TauT family transport system substrate-binding protein